MAAARHILVWLYACCFMIFAMAVIGAVTRLTESGLSITEWKPLTGALPPLTERDWEAAFALYKQSPEFIHKHSWMTLADYKNIFFWEWLHRLWGRLIGIVYALPFLYFLVKKQISKRFGFKLFGVLVLGGFQGFMGWYMVQSGLVDHPSVSHYRLAAHLLLALIIFSCLWWLALDIKKAMHAEVNLKLQNNDFETVSSDGVFVLGLSCLALVFVTTTWGAFTAGLDAGLIYNSFPLMAGKFFPPESFSGLPSLLEQQAWVQFTHRWLAITTVIALMVFSYVTRNLKLAGMAILQMTLGITTLLTGVNIVLAALHQAGAIIVLALVLSAIYSVTEIRRKQVRAGAAV